MENNKAVTAFWYAMVVMVASGGVAISVLTKSWIPIAYASAIVIGFFLVSLLISALFCVVFAPLMWLMGKFTGKAQEPKVDREK